MENNIKEKNEIIEKLKSLIEELKENFPNIDEQIEDIFTKTEIFFMQNLNEYDIYSLREAIFELSGEYLEEEKELEVELLFHTSMIFSYIKENLHPIELADEGIVYNDIYVKFLLSLTDEDVSLSYPLAVDYVNDILTREGFLRNFLTEEEILENGIFFYKSVEGKILDFCFNKALFNQTPIVLEKFIKYYDDDSIKFNEKFAKSLYQNFYTVLEKKFGNIKGKNKKFSGKLLDKNIIKLQKYIQSVVDDKELQYMLSVAKENTANIFLLNINDFIRNLKENKGLGALRLSLGLGIENKAFLKSTLSYIPTEDFLNGIIALLKNYQNLDNISISDMFDGTVEEFITAFALNIPLITDNPDTLKLYDILLDEFRKFLVKIETLDTDEPVENFSPYFKYFYLFKKFKFKEANKLFDKYSEELEDEEDILMMNLISKFITGDIEKGDLAEKLDNIFEKITSFVKKENEGEENLSHILIYGGYIKLLKYLLTEETDETAIYKLIKAYIENDRKVIENILKGYYDEEGASLEDIIKGYDTLLKTVAYEVLNIYPFDKRVYQLYNPSYKYKVPKIEDNRVIWV